MPKFKVRKYDTFVEFYPGSTIPKKCYLEGEIVEIDDIKKCDQAHKLESVSEAEAKVLETPQPVIEPDDLFVDPMDMNQQTGSKQVNDADRKNAAEALRNGSKGK